jgi:hypothetical protein
MIIQKFLITMQGLVTTHHSRISQLKNATTTIFQSNLIRSSTMLFKRFKENVATLLWPSVGVKPNTWKK